MTKVNDIILGVFIGLMLIGGFWMSFETYKMDREIQKLEMQKVELQIHIQKLSDEINKENTELVI